jgi:hypothetical protein
MIDTEGRQEDPRPTRAAARHRTHEIRRRGSTRRPFAVSEDLLGVRARGWLGKATYPNPVDTRSEPGAPSPDPPPIRPPIRSHRFGCSRVTADATESFGPRAQLARQPVSGRSGRRLRFRLSLTSRGAQRPRVAADSRGSGGAVPPGPTSPGSPARGGTSLRDVRSRLREVHRARRTGASRPLALLQARGPSRRKPGSGVPCTVAPRRGPESSPRPRAARPVWVKDGRAGRSPRAPSGFRGSRLPPASDMKRRL